MTMDESKKAIRKDKKNNFLLNVILLGLFLIRQIKKYKKKK